MIINNIDNFDVDGMKDILGAVSWMNTDMKQTLSYEKNGMMFDLYSEIVDHSDRKLLATLISQEDTVEDLVNLFNMQMDENTKLKNEKQARLHSADHFSTVRTTLATLITDNIPDIVLNDRLSNGQLVMHTVLVKDSCDYIDAAVKKIKHNIITCYWRLSGNNGPCPSVTVKVDKIDGYYSIKISVDFGVFVYYMDTTEQVIASSVVAGMKNVASITAEGSIVWSDGGIDGAAREELIKRTKEIIDLLYKDTHGYLIEDNAILILEKEAIRLHMEDLFLHDKFKSVMQPTPDVTFVFNTDYDIEVGIRTITITTSLDKPSEIVAKIVYDINKTGHNYMITDIFKETSFGNTILTIKMV